MRVLKFGIVGISGVLVNLGSLYLFKNYVFNNINITIFNFDLGFNLSLISAISISIVSNFIFNKKWTWNDRRPPSLMDFKLIWKYLAIYIFASIFSIIIQIIFSNIYINLGLNYILASLTAIAMGACVNFFINNKYIFKKQL
jgi:dolichol-phosphate mannosyltransferase